MTTVRRSLLCVLLLPTVFAGCSSVGEDRFARKATEGGFSVLVDGPDHPAAARVAADIGAFARNRGFAPQPALPGPALDPLTREPIPRAPERYSRGTLELDVTYQPATHRVSAYLHDPASARERKSIRRFYEEFHKEFAPSYGRPDPISESAFSGDQPNFNDPAQSYAPADPRAGGGGRGS